MIDFASKSPHSGTTIFTVMSHLATTHGAINLSQGFPDFECSAKLTHLVNHYMQAGYNQYAPMTGVLSLRERIAVKTEQLYQALYHPEREITITSGATQAIFTAIATVVRPGDEVIIFEPAYDCYAPAVNLFGGIIHPVRLSAPDFSINWDAVKQLVSPKTRLIIINTPNNPSATVFSATDMQQLIALTAQTNILILSDEVYSHILLNKSEPQSVSYYPELRERSFVVASFGKLYHTTGWKIGYCLAPEQLTTAFRNIHQYLVFSVNTPMQHALADFLDNPEEYLQLGPFFQEKHDFLLQGLKQSAFKALPSAGTYFLLADYSSISNLNDIDFCRELTINHGVAAIPLSAFYSIPNKQRLIRFCFAKKQDTLKKAIDKLRAVSNLG